MFLSIIDKKDDNIDSDIISDIINGNKDKFEYIIRKYDKKIYVLIKKKYYLTNDEMDDIMQDTFIKCYKNLKSFKRDRSFYPWLSTIAINITKDFLKKKIKRKSRTDKLYEDSFFLLNQDSINHSIDELDRIDRAIKLLETDQKEVILLRAEGLSYNEISKKLNLPLGTVMSRLNRARKKILDKCKI